MATFEISYGRQSLSIEIPAARVTGVLAPHEVQPLDDIDASVRTALAHPIGSDPFETFARGHKSALIITVDNTRPSPETMLVPMVEMLKNEGVAVTIINATGRHRQMTERELESHLGEYLMANCHVLQHDPFDSDNMARKGITARGTRVWVNQELFRHDLVIGCGIIEPSYLCGWSGGRKLLMPGLAHYASIDNNHYYLTQPGAKIGRLYGNPVSDDAFEFMERLPLHFILYAVCGPNDEFVSIVAGDRIEAHERGCALCEPIFRVPRQEADIVISSPGGWPYDFDLVQGKKAVIPATEAVRENGVIILCAECGDGLGAEVTFIDWLRNKTPFDVARDVLDRGQFNLGAHGANILAKPIVEKGATVILVTCADVADALRGTYITAVTDLEEAWQIADATSGPESDVLFIENARRLIVE
jgi:nickel-dependent lactate racemase